MMLYWWCVFADASGYSVLWHVTTGQVLSSKKEEGQSLAAAVAPGCESFCTSGSDGYVLVYDANTHTKIRTLEPRSAEWNECLGWLILQAPLPSLPHSKSTTLMDGHVNRVFSARYHPINPSLLISTGWDNTIQVLLANG